MEDDIELLRLRALAKAKAGGTSATQNAERYNENEAQPGISWGERTIAKNFGSTPEAMAAYIKQEHPDYDVKVHEGEVFAKSPMDQEYKALDPKGFFGKGIFHPSTWDYKDLSDLPVDLASGAVQGAAGSIAAVPGILSANPPLAVGGAMVGSGAATAGTETLKQALGKALGIPDNMNASEIAQNAAIGTLAPGAGMLIGKALKPVGSGVSALGKKIYNSAFSKADRALETEYGKGSIADLLRKERFKGNAEEAVTAAEELHNRLGAALGTARKNAGEAPALPATFENVDKLIERYRSLPDAESQKIADKLEAMYKPYLGMGGKSVEEVAGIKKTLANMAGGDSYFRQMKSAKENAKSDLRAALAAEFNKAENKGVENYMTPEEFAGYLQTKKDYGITSSFGQKKLAQGAAQEANRIGVAPGAFDYMAGGAAVASGNPVAVAGMAAKKARDIARLTGTKTRVGLGLEDTGSYMQNGLQEALSSGQALPAQVWLNILNRENNNEK